MIWRWPRVRWSKWTAIPSAARCVAARIAPGRTTARTLVAAGLFAALPIGEIAAVEDLAPEYMAPAPPPIVRSWPHDRDIHVGYRLIGDYWTLRQRLRASEPYGMGAYWERAFDVIADVDIERLLLDRMARFAALTGLRIIPQPYEHSDPASFDICIEIYLSDRLEDLTSFPCLAETQRSVPEARRIEAFVTWGWAATYGTETTVHHAACLAVYSAFTFREDLRRSAYQAIAEMPPAYRLGMWPPFFPLSGEMFAGPIMGDWLGFFGRIRQETGRSEVRDDAGNCRWVLRDTYRRQMTRIIDNCLVSALGLPISDTIPTTITSIDDPLAPSYVETLSRRTIGTQDWVKDVGTIAMRLYQESPRLRLLEGRADDLLRALYATPMSAAALQEFARTELGTQLTTALAAAEAPEERALFREIEPHCFGPQ
ncbi:MAG: hypothetical protein H6842_07155 [Rhodospirillaceae bacterium]|nr:hypothetical protein [Rhodospirillaceae bacterium]